MNFCSFIVEFLFSISFDFNSCSNLVYFDLIQVNFDVKFQKKNQEKMWRSFQKQDKGAKQWNKALQFKVRKFRTMESNMRKFISRCEFLKLQFRTPQGHFRTVRIKVRNSFQCAKQGANSLNVNFAHHCSRCETPSWHTSAILHTTSHFSHRANQGAKFSHSAKLSAKFNLRCEILSFECENFARCNPKCEILNSRCENFAQ